MESFKVGDKVVLVDASNAKPGIYTIGKVYEVIRSEHSRVSIVWDDGKERSASARRFRLATSLDEVLS